MKKTLVALAVLAASGASFAQVAITGEVAYGFASNQAASGAQTSGLGVDTATLDFGVTEDLGGGMKIEAHQGFDTLSRSTVIGGDTTMALSTSAFKVSLGTALLGDYLNQGIANTALNLNAFDGRIQSAKVTKDYAGIAFPVGAFTLSVTEYEAAAGTGLGVGTAGNSGQRNTQYQVAYANGALAANAAYKPYDNGGTTATATKSATRASVSYDFGMAKVGGGIVSTSMNTGTQTDGMLSVAAPIGAAVTIGAAYNVKSTNGTASDYSYSGYGLQLTYALSKSTSIQADYLNWQDQYNGGYQGSASTLTEVALVKTF